MTGSSNLPPSAVATFVRMKFVDLFHLPKIPRYILLIVGITFVFCVSIALDITPLLRGPEVWPFGWRWEYSFTNTLWKLPIPIIAASIIFYFFARYDGRTEFIKHNEKKILFLFVFLGYFFLLSVFHYSRAGVPVLLHRIIHQEINGYFTESLSVTNPFEYLKSYADMLPTNVGHAVSHPAGSVLWFWAANQTIEKIPYISHIGNSLVPGSDTVRILWFEMTAHERTAALFHAMAIPLLSFFTLFPLYYLVKYLCGVNVAFRSAVFYLFLPNLIFFSPINDVLLPLFGFGSLYFGIKGVGWFRKTLSGFILSIGVFMSLSLFPFVIVLFIYHFIRFLKKNFTLTFFILEAVYFLSGFLLLPFFLLIFFHYNSIEVAYVAASVLPVRPYAVWVFYTFYDFFVYTGIPASILYLASIKNVLSEVKTKTPERINVFLAAFTITFLLLILSGKVQGEIGRIWMIFSPFLIIFASYVVTSKIRFSKKAFLIILVIQLVQILVMQEFWLMAEYGDEKIVPLNCFFRSQVCL